MGKADCERGDKLPIDAAIGAASLQGANILVTRPRPQAARLCELIEEYDGIPIAFPTIDIQPLPRQPLISQTLDNINDYDWLIFVSTNAVKFTLQLIDGKIAALSRCRIAAIGNATACCLQREGLTVDLRPEYGFNSEALLEMAEFNAVRGQKCLLVRGVGGRETLAETLRERGAQVDYLEVYRRDIATTDVRPLLTLLQQHRLSAITSYSEESLQNLRLLLGDHADSIVSLPLVVISQRLAKLAEQRGFKSILVSASPEDEDILRTLTTIKWGK